MQKPFLNILSLSLNQEGINLHNMHGIGYDGASTRQVIKVVFKYTWGCGLNLHCVFIAAATNYNLLQLEQLMKIVKWKGLWETYLLFGNHFIIYPKLAEIQAELNSPELKMQKPSDTFVVAQLATLTLWFTGLEVHAPRPCNWYNPIYLNTEQSSPFKLER